MVVAELHGPVVAGVPADSVPMSAERPCRWHCPRRMTSLSEEVGRRQSEMARVQLEVHPRSWGFRRPVAVVAGVVLRIQRRPVALEVEVKAWIPLLAQREIPQVSVLPKEQMAAMVSKSAPAPPGRWLVAAAAAPRPQDQMGSPGRPGATVEQERQAASPGAA